MLTPAQQTILLDTIAADGTLNTIWHSSDGAFQIAAHFNAMTEEGLTPIPMADVLIWAAQEDRYSRIEAHIADTAGVGTICKVALLILSNPQVPNLDLADPTIVGLLDALVTATVLDAADKTALVAIATVPVSRSQALIGVPVLSVEDILALWDV